MTALIAHLRHALPNEGCALLAGPQLASPNSVVTTWFSGTNALASPTRYRMEPQEVVDAFRTMRERTLKLVAIAHSHPRTNPIPSRIDWAEANYPEAAMVIVSFQENQPDVAVWRLDGSSAAPMRRIALRIGTGT